MVVKIQVALEDMIALLAAAKRYALLVPDGPTNLLAIKARVDVQLSAAVFNEKRAWGEAEKPPAPSVTLQVPVGAYQGFGNVLYQVRSQED